MEITQDYLAQKTQDQLPTLSAKQITAVLNLLNEGNTVPFIARYRKDQTGSLDEVAIRDIQDTYTSLERLEERKASVIQSISKQGKLTEDLERDIRAADHMQQVEDLYLPYKQKRRTKATIARENGLAPLADQLREFTDEDPLVLAEAFIQEGEGADIQTAQDALDGAHEIIAEEVGDSAKYRTRIRQITQHIGKMSSTKKKDAEDPKGVYEMYYDFEESVKTIQNHRILAINRGEKEGVLSASIQLDDEQATTYLLSQELPKNSQSPAINYVQAAVEDGYKRFIKPAIEREIRNNLTDRAESEAIDLFGENLKNLLIQPPLKEQTILGFDPAYRTGCKLAVIDSSGKVLDIAIIYPHEGASKAKRAQAGPELKEIIEKHEVDIVAIGNGTASRESEVFVAEVIQDLDRPVAYTIVDEAGASVYSASEEARREFPDLEVEERSAVSIARRLQDPLAELVKIDPKSIGVGQYQHDVNEKELDEELDFVVETVVNRVGVNVNTASVALLKHIAGMTPKTAENIVAYREENGPYKSREELKSVPQVGPKTYNQAVGFLRIPQATLPFDNTGIHPESYAEAEKILEMTDLSTDDLGSDHAKEVLLAADKKALSQAVGLGEETLDDVLEAMASPGRDMRDDLPAPRLQTQVVSMEDLEVGMEVEGTVRNVVDFGAFIDIGVKQDGLVHVSKLSERFVKHPSEILAVGDIVKATVIGVDLDRERISLSLI